MKILQILSHPDYNNKNRVSNLLADYGEKILKENNENSIKTLNLYDPNCYIPQMDKNMFNYKDKNLSRQEEIDSVRQKCLLAQWQASNVVIIYMPLHNFNITAKFKDYIDNIVIVNETFKCTEEEMIGLDNSDKRVIFVLTSGGEFDKHIQYVNLDFTVQFMRGILSVMGIDKMDLVRCQGLDLEFNDKEQIIEDTKKELEKLLRHI